MKARHLKVLGAVCIVALVSTACSSLIKGDPDPRWADYKNWTKITEGKTGTGDPTGYIGGVHMGQEGYRDVYVNEVGKAALEGSAPYVFPVGTVVVKEQFKSKAAWESQSKPGVTVSLKKADGSGSADNWEWASSYTGKAGKSDFCAGCHTIALASDFVFTTGDFLATQE